MTDHPINLAMIGRLVRRRWPVLLVLALVGGVLGLGLSALLSPGFASTSKVLLQGERDKNTIPSEVQVATSLVVLDRTAAALNSGLSSRDLQSRVSATVEDGNVIQIVGTGPSPELAQQLTDAVTNEYVKFSSQIAGDAAAAVNDATQRARDSTQQRLDEATAKVGELTAEPAVNQPGPEGDRARSDLQQAQAAADQAAKEVEASEKRLQEIQVAGALNQANLRLIQPAVLPTGPASPTPFELAAGGAAALPLLGIFGSLVALRSDRRVRDRADFAGILGAPVLADVTVPATRPAGRLGKLHDDRLWVAAEPSVPEDENTRGIRYRRMLARLRRDAGPQRVLALVLDGDETARVALLDLALITAATGRSVSLGVADEAFAEAAHAATAHPTAGGRLSVDLPGAPAPAADLLLTVAVLDPVRPAVPDGPADELPLLIITVASRTPFELNAVAGAFVDAGRPLTGVLVAVPGHGAGRRGKQADDFDDPAASAFLVGPS